MSSSVSNAAATVLEWIFRIILICVAFWLISMGLTKFDQATFSKTFVGFTDQIKDRLPHRLTNSRARLDSTFYTNRVFFIDMTLGNDIRNNPPVEDIHKETRDFLESTVSGPDKFGETVRRYQVSLTYRFIDATGSPLSDHTIPPAGY
jgi:hypothetical protein